jgi:hypothetical protein
VPADARHNPVLSATTLQSCSALGVACLFGLSTQSPEYQLEAVTRLHLQFSLLSDDEALALTRAMNLPTFETAGMTLLKCLTLLISNGTIEHLFYALFPLDRSARNVVSWLSERVGGLMRNTKLRRVLRHGKWEKQIDGEVLYLRRTRRD